MTLSQNPQNKVHKAESGIPSPDVLNALEKTRLAMLRAMSESKLSNTDGLEATILYAIDMGVITRSESTEYIELFLEIQKLGGIHELHDEGKKFRFNELIAKIRSSKIA